MKPGGTEGGGMLYIIGLILITVGGYLFFDSVRVQTGGAGILSRGLSGGRGGFMETTSMGIVFVPFLAGIAALTFDSSKKWPWVLSGLGIVLIAVEILSRVQFVMNTKVPHLLMMLGMIAAGAGMIAKAVYQDNKAKKKSEKESNSEKK